MNTLSLLNQKGGTGKTTSVVSLADLWSREFDVLAVDMDPQASLSRWIASPQSRCMSFLSGDMGAPDAAVGTEWGFDVVPSDRSLATLESRPVKKIVQRLEKLLSVARKSYDVCLIDPPPSTGFLVIASLVASDAVIAPVQTGQGAIDGLTDTIYLVNDFQSRFEGAFACKVDLRTVNDREMPGILKENFEDRAFDTFIRNTVQVKEAEAEGTPPPSYSPDATATEDYESLANEIQQRL
jgi:chromosome partitioning protein